MISLPTYESRIELIEDRDRNQFFGVELTPDTMGVIVESERHADWIAELESEVFTKFNWMCDIVDIDPHSTDLPDEQAELLASMASVLITSTDE